MLELSYPWHDYHRDAPIGSYGRQCVCPLHHTRRCIWVGDKVRSGDYSDHNRV